MEHGLELILARLEILEIEVCNIIYKPRDIGNMSFLDFWGFLQKRRAPKFHAEWSRFRGEISHMRPIQARKLKLFQTPISR